MQILYSPYGIGLTTLALTVLITGFTYKKWKEKYLHIACFLVILLPVFQYVLNGGFVYQRKGFDTNASAALLFDCHVSGKTKKQRDTFWAGDFTFYGNDYYDNTDGKVFLIDAGVMLFSVGCFFIKTIRKKY